MTEAKFKVGQMVCLKAAMSHEVVGRAASYKILALLPQNGRRWSYRVKTILEPEARFAEQDELVLLSARLSSSVAALPQGITKG